MSEALIRNPDVVFQELDGEVLVLRQGSSDVLHLNRTASDVWDLLAEPTSSDELVALLAQAYGEDEGRVRGDLAPLLELLLAQDVVRVA